MTSGVRILMVSLALTASMLAACASGSRSAGTTSSTSTQAAAPTAPAASEGRVVQEVLVVVSGAKLLLAGPGARQACDALTPPAWGHACHQVSQSAKLGVRVGRQQGPPTGLLDEASAG